MKKMLQISTSIGIDPNRISFGFTGVVYTRAAQYLGKNIYIIVIMAQYPASGIVYFYQTLTNQMQP